MAKEDTFHLGVKALIKNNKNEYLLLQTNPVKLRGYQGEPYWDIPGGRIERGSTPIQTLQREILEETGIEKITKQSFFGMTLSNIRIPINNNSDVGLILSIYECSAEITNQIKLSDEHMGFGWFDKKKTAEHLSFKYPKEFIDLLRGNK